MTLSLRYAARSHTGLLRTGNEDSVYAGPRLLAVADGMGGHAAGEVASAVAISALAPLDHDTPGADLLGALRDSALSANEHLRDMVRGDPALEGMGTTLVALLFSGGRLGLLHVGDSRCYLLRDGQLTQITHDHTLVQTLVDEGRISEEDASTHPQRSLITRALDGRGGVELDLSVREARVGDRYLVCSDGLTGPVGSLDTLREALSIRDPQESVDRLVQLALRGGGPDNITVIVADVVPSGDGTGTPVIAGAAAEAPQPPPPGLEEGPAARAREAEGRTTVPQVARVPAPPYRPPPSPPSPRRRSRGLLALLGVVALLLAVAGGGFAYLRTQYYVGVDAGTVALFNGIPGVPLASVEERTGLQVDALPADLADAVRGSEVVGSREEVAAYLSRLEEEASPTPTPTPSPSPAPTVPGQRTATPAASPAAT